MAVERDWSKSHNGVMLCSFEKTIELMPEVEEILEGLYPILEFPKEEYFVDVKIHMLMPKQYPCIPNWHRDFVPRDENMERDFRAITGEKMYMWLSGTPLTEYKTTEGVDYLKGAQEWHTFTQNDLHRGTLCTEHTWRCFIRVIPKKFVHPFALNVGQLRRHTQVYLDSKKFNW
tara:strand:- start:81633 stop:82154 length:522 start_codon:yes stop_codon:yes gene_type:complete